MLGKQVWRLLHNKDSLLQGLKSQIFSQLLYIGWGGEGEWLICLAKHTKSTWGGANGVKMENWEWTICHDLWWQVVTWFVLQPSGVAVEKLPHQYLGVPLLTRKIDAGWRIRYVRNFCHMKLKQSSTFLWALTAWRTGWSGLKRQMDITPPSPHINFY